MEVQPQTKLQFLGVEIYRTDFSSFKRQTKEDKSSINFNVSPKVIHHAEVSKFSIVMEANVECEEFYRLQIGLIGHFQLNGEISEEIRNVFINSNAPAIVFPYLRSFISSFTSNLGPIITGPITIPPQFFQGELEKYQQPNANPTNLH